MPIDLGTIVAGGVGATLGFAGHGALRWWQYRRDAWTQRIERFCETVDEAAKASTEYWIARKAKPSELGDSSEPESNSVKKYDLLNGQECRLIGLQSRIDGLFASYCYRLHEDATESCKISLAAFTDALTGGEFQAASRAPDYDRARLVQIIASEIIVAVRIAADEAITARGLRDYYFQRAKRRQMSAINGGSGSIR